MLLFKAGFCGLICLVGFFALLSLSLRGFLMEMAVKSGLCVFIAGLLMVCWRCVLGGVGVCVVIVCLFIG